MIIYKVTNLINGKIYIGQTRRGFEERVHEHKTKSLKPSSSNYNCVFYRAIRKHGVENFIFEKIDDALSVDELNEKESYWINFYNSFANNEKGYNSTTGGESLEFCDISRLKMSASQGGKPFLIFDQNGNLVRRYEIQRDCEELGISSKRLYQLLNGIATSSKGYIAIYEHDFSEELLQERLKKCKNTKRHGVNNINAKLDKDTVRIIKGMLMEGETQKSIADKFGVDKTNIGSIARNLTWRHVEVEGWSDYVSKDKKIKGERIGSSSLTEEDVVKIKTMLLKGEKRKSIAEIFNVSYGSIVHIDNNSTWKHVRVSGWDEYLKRKSFKAG